MERSKEVQRAKIKWDEINFGKVVSILKCRDIKNFSKGFTDYYRSKYELLEVGNTTNIVLKKKKPDDPIIFVVPFEKLYDKLVECHVRTGHGGRDKMEHELKKKFQITRVVIQEFFKLCTICQGKKQMPPKNLVVQPIISKDFNSRGQVDLVDLQSVPDEQFKWILNHQDQATNFCHLRHITLKGLQKWL